jgi:hypothetical protein
MAVTPLALPTFANTSDVVKVSCRFRIASESFRMLSKCLNPPLPDALSLPLLHFTTQQ